MKRLCLLLACVFLITLLPGCGGSSTSKIATRDPVKGSISQPQMLDYGGVKYPPHDPPPTMPEIPSIDPNSFGRDPVWNKTMQLTTEARLHAEAVRNWIEQYEAWLYRNDKKVYEEHMRQKAANMGYGLPPYAAERFARKKAERDRIQDMINKSRVEKFRY